MTVTTLHSVLRCPNCGHEEALEMPTNACVFFHDCIDCHTLLRPMGGDCCVFCSFGSVRCPPKQQGSGGCCSTEVVPAGDNRE